MAATTEIPSAAQALVARGLLGLPDPVLRLLAGRAVIIDGQRLHPEVQVGLKLLSLGADEPLDRLPVAQARTRVSDKARTFQGRPIQVSRVEERMVAGADGALSARLYVPDRAAGVAGNSAGMDGLLVYFHGGGFVVGDLDTHDNVCRFLARQAEVRVLAIDYRLAPEHRFPAAIDDAVAAFRFAAEHASELGASPTRIAVGGDSAGGNLAAGVARLVATGNGPAPVFQMLFYPWLDLSAKRRSHRLFADGFFLTDSELDWYKGHYVENERDALDPRCSPLLAEDLSAAAPAYIATAGFDPVRDEGEDYAARLRAAGVRVALRRHPGLVHGFVNARIGHTGREALLEAAGALRLALAA